MRKSQTSGRPSLGTQSPSKEHVEQTSNRVEEIGKDLLLNYQKTLKFRKFTGTKEHKGWYRNI